jgi:hypothetical protein
MRLSALILVAIAASACSQDTGPAPTVRYPTAPAPPGSPPTSNPSSGLTFLLGLIIDETGACIVGASVQVLDGQRAGESMTQETPCDAWGYSGGFEFDSLTPGVPMTLRASAQGYVDRDTTVYPTLGVQQYTELELSRAAGH